MNKKAKKFILDLADKLEKVVPVENFDMSCWCSNLDSGENIVMTREPKCGTTACALGWAAVLFPSLGVRLTAYDDFIDKRTGDFLTPSDVSARKGLSETEHDALFQDPAHLKTPKAWAKFARAYVAAAEAYELAHELESKFNFNLDW